MKKKLFCCVIALMLLVAGCAELPTASYADGSPESSESAPESSGSEGESEASASAPESSSAATLPPKEVTENTLRICVDINHISSGIERDTQIGMDRILKTTVFLSDMNNFGAMNEVYATFFTEGSYPARSAVEVARLPKDALVEIEVIAAK